eukprot:CAMPEP_0174718098 /NCGR_PEP_ID=MMETSP1094-20130205/28022_1 /TAXON_ID=156173 /ORGANISM="Chrysochromulina brevifilum, Strain UTEX LB 985" /LENGTH=337 /DNA_ID=CAMNT_0015918133 /DNA_START=24 /DNA_END=1037 /DNA_ORIENTATION=-
MSSAEHTAAGSVHAPVSTRRDSSESPGVGNPEALEKWRAVYKPSDVAASRLTAMADEGCVLPTMLKTTYKGVERSVVYIRWSAFKPAGSDLERKVSLLEYCAFIFDKYHQAGEHNLIFCYDYAGWSLSQSDPPLVSDIVNLSGRYGFDSYNCIVDAPMVFMPLWYTLKSTVLPSYIVAKTDFITTMPQGVSYAAAKASFTEWFAAAKIGGLKPDDFESRLHSVYLTAKDVRSAKGKEFAIGKAGSNNLLSRSAKSYKTRYFKVLVNGDMRTLAYGQSSGFTEAKRVCMLDGATWSLIDCDAKRFAFQLKFVDGQEFNLSLKDQAEALHFLAECGLRN